MNNLPNILTAMRILVIPILVLVFYLPVPWGHPAAAAIFTVASITDWLDGYLARSLSQSTKLGAFLDPVADKLMVSISLVLIVAQPPFLGVYLDSLGYNLPIALITVPAAIIISREIVVSALREWMAEVGKRAKLAVSNLGKIKTTIQMISLIVLLFCRPETSGIIAMIGYILLYVAAILTLWSMMIYLKAAWPELIKH